MSSSQLTYKCCCSTEFQVLYKSPDGETVTRCRGCGLVFSESGLPKKKVRDCYGQEYYSHWQEEINDRRRMWKKRLVQLNKFRRSGSLLDIGCGLGDFARIARDYGWDVTATELSEYAVQYAAREHNIKVIKGEIADIDFGRSKFDVITMWHVLEHTENPLKALKRIYDLLDKDGWLVIEVPNVYYLVQMVKSYLKTKNAFSVLTLKNNPEPHYFHFSPTSLKNLLHSAGFKVANISVGVYGEHQSGVLRRLKSKLYNILTKVVYLLLKKNIGVNTRIYAVKKKPLSLAMISLIVRRDLDKPLDDFQRIDIKHYYKNVPYNDMTSAEVEETRLVKYKNGLDLFIKILKQKPDLIQGIEPYTFPAGLGEYMAVIGLNLFRGIPFFFPMLENRPVREKFGGFLAPLLKLYLWFYAVRALFIIPVNQGAEKNLIDAGVPRDKFKKILWGCWGVDLEEFSPESRPVPLAEDKEKIILFAGRLHYSKGISYLLEAFDRLRKEYPLKLVIIGEGQEKKNIIDFCEDKGLKDGVILTGGVKNEKMPGYFRAAYITVTPSITIKRWEEQVGMVNLQSLACGVPVVSTYSGAIPEFVKDKEVGLLVKEKDVDGLYTALKKLLCDKELYSKMSSSGRKYCVENFDSLKNIRKAEELLLEKVGLKG